MKIQFGTTIIVCGMDVYHYQETKFRLFEKNNKKKVFSARWRSKCITQKFFYFNKFKR